MAGRNREYAADYFSHDADASSDEKIVYIESLFGHKGYAVYFKFLERMARSDNFEIEWNDIKKAIYAAEFNISVAELDNIVTECCRKEIKAFQIVNGKMFSVGLKKRMRPLLEKRTYNRLKYEEKKTQPISVAEKTQSKVKESKVKERKKNKKKKTQLPTEYPLSERHIEYALGKKYPQTAIPDLFEGFCLHHRQNGNTKIDWYLAWCTWVRNDIKWNGLPEQKSEGWDI